MPATSPRNNTHVLVNWESYVQGQKKKKTPKTPATELAFANSDNRERGPKHSLRSGRWQSGRCLHRPALRSQSWTRTTQNAGFTVGRVELQPHHDRRGPGSGIGPASIRVCARQFTAKRPARVSSSLASLSLTQGLRSICSSWRRVAVPVSQAVLTGRCL